MKKVETHTETKYYCDVCGKEADGAFSIGIRCNGNMSYESYWNCPFDLCKNCMHNYMKLLVDNADRVVNSDWAKISYKDNPDNLTHTMKSNLKQLKKMHQEQADRAERRATYEFLHLT